MKLPNTIDSILKNRYGIDYTILGEAVLDTLIRNRCQACNNLDNESYFEYLRTSPQEMHIFFEGLLVPETWFFRDPTLFSHLSLYLRSLGKKTSHLRILCLPCATGEEVYSVIITILNEGFTRDQFSILGVDISNIFLGQAKKGLYKKNAFRGTELNTQTQTHYFETLENNFYQIKPEVKECAQFIQGNIVDPFLLNEEEPFNIILSRNVLIYLSESGRERAIKNIDHLLKPEGILFVGHADSLTSQTDDFLSVGDPAAFAYCKKEAQSVFQALFPFKRIFKKSNNTLARSFTSSKTEKIKSPSTLDKELFQQAQASADQGNLAQALESISQYIQKNRHNSEAYFLYGGILSAQNKKKEAEQAYKQAISLNEFYEEALFQLELLYRGSGNIQDAKKINQRRLALHTRP